MDVNKKHLFVFLLLIAIILSVSTASAADVAINDNTAFASNGNIIHIDSNVNIPGGLQYCKSSDLVSGEITSIGDSVGSSTLESGSIENQDSNSEDKVVDLTSDVEISISDVVIVDDRDIILTNDNEYTFTDLDNTNSHNDEGLSNIRATSTEIQKENTKLSYNLVNTTSGEKLIILLTDYNDNPISSASVNIKFRELNSNPITMNLDNEGTLELTIPQFSPGTYNIDISYLGDNRYGSSEATASFVIDKFSSSIIINNIGQVGQDLFINLSAKDKEGNNICGGQFVITIDDNDYVLDIDKDGVASSTINGLNAGNYNVPCILNSTNYDGKTFLSFQITNQQTEESDDIGSKFTENPSTEEDDVDEAIFDDDSEEGVTATAIYASNAEFYAQEDGELIIILTDGEGNPIVGKDVKVRVKGVTLYGTTDSDGIAEILFEGTKAGKYSAIAYFDGDGYYEPSKYKFKITVKSLGPGPKPEPTPSPSPNPYHGQGSKSVGFFKSGIQLYKTGNPIAMLIVSLMSIPALGIGRSANKENKNKYLAILAILLVLALSISVATAADLESSDIDSVDVSSVTVSSIEEAPNTNVKVTSDVLVSDCSDNQSDDINNSDNSNNTDNSLKSNSVNNKNSNNQILTLSAAVQNNNDSQKINAAEISVSDIDNSYDATSTENIINTNLEDFNSDVEMSKLAASAIEDIEAGDVPSLGAATLHVGTGQTYRTLNDAYRAASNGDTIIIHGGTYNTYSSGSLTIAKSINIIANDPSETVILTAHNGNSYNYVILTVSAANVNISGIRFSGARHEDNGGAIVWSGANGTVDNCIFYNNSITSSNSAYGSAYNGGAIYWTGNNGTLKNSVLYNNSINGRRAGGSGGTVYWSGSYGNILNTTIINSTISYTGSSWSGPSGMAMTVNGAYTNIDGLKIYGSSCSDEDAGMGALYVDDNGGHTVINNSVFENNIGYIGGALRLGNGGLTNITILNCNISNNHATEHGAATCINAYDLYMANCNVINNTAPLSAGINAHTANNTFYNCTFIGNRAEDSTEGFGGAVSLNITDSSTYSGNSLINCTFEKNYAAVGGAAIYIKGSDANVINCSVSNNTAHDGAGVYINGANATVNNTVVRNNNATNGSGIYINGTSARINNITAVNNNATNGSGIYINGTSSVVTNVNATNNNATNGAGVYINGNNATLNGYVLTNNNASANGGGLYIVGANAKIANATFSNNTASNGAGIYVNGNYTNLTNVTIVNNIATNGSGAYIQGLNTTITNSNISYNNATNGSGMFINGNNLKITNSTIGYNNATYNGGGAYIKGDYTTVVNSEFEYNNAIPSNGTGKIDGLGGALYIEGNNAVINDSTFSYNTARNGSAVYLTGTANFTNDSFNDNQAFVYRLPTFNNNIVINSTVYGGNNILNAIYNSNGVDAIYINGSHPHNGSISGNVIYQDDREKDQPVRIEVWDPTGKLVYNATGITNEFGLVEFPVQLSEDIWYVCRLTHLEDTYYKYITNTTALNVKEGLNVASLIMYEGDPNTQTIYMILANDNKNTIPDASHITLELVYNNGTRVLLTNTTSDENGLVVFETTYFANLAAGTYTLYGAYDGATGGYHACNATGTLIVLPLNYHIIKQINSTDLYPGDDVSFNITVINDGSEPGAILRNVIIKDIYDSSFLTYLDFVGDAWTYSSASQSWTYNGEIAPGANATLTVKFRVLKSGTSYNYANVTNGLSYNSTNITFTVKNRTNTTVTVSNVTGMNGTTVTQTITVKDINENLLNGTVDVYVNGTFNRTLTVTNGVAQFTYNIPGSARTGDYYNVTAKFNQTRIYEASQGSGNINAYNKYNIIIIGDNRTVYTGETITGFIINVTTQDGGPVFNGDVDVTLPNGTIKSITITNGQGSFDIPTTGLATGTYNIPISYAGNDTYFPATGTGKITILPKVNTVITITNVTGYPGQNVVLNLSLKDSENNPISSDIVVVQVGVGRYDIILTDANGFASFNYTIPINDVEGTVHTFNANYLGSNKYNPNSTLGKVTVLPLTYHIEKERIDNNVLYPNDTIRFRITVVNDGTDLAAILRNVTVSDLFNSADLTYISTSASGWTYNNNAWKYNGDIAANTNASFTVTFKINRAGNLVNNATVTINEGLSSNNTTTSFTVLDRNATNITITGGHGLPGATVPINVTLIDSTSGMFLSGDVDIYVNGSYNRTIHVIDGRASFNYVIPANATVGSTYVLSAVFNQTRTHNASSASNNVIVDPYTIVIIGDNRTVYPGEQVTNFKINITTNDNGPVFNGDVTVSFPDSWALANQTVTIVNGVGYLNFTPGATVPAGVTYPIAINFTGNANYTAATGTGNVTLKKYEVTINVTNNITMYIGDGNEYSIGINLTAPTDMPASVYANHSVVIYAYKDGVYTEIGTINVDLNGVATFTGNDVLKDLDIGTYTLYANSSDFDSQWIVTNINNTLIITDLVVITNKVVTNSSVFYIGDEVWFNITVTNNGNATLHDISINDTSIDGLTLISGSGTNWVADGTGRWYYNGSLAIGETATLTVVFKITKDIVNEVTNLTNIANVTVNGNNVTKPNATIEVTPQNHTILTITNATGFPDETITMNVTLSDVNGQGLKYNVTVKDENGHTWIVELNENGMGFFTYTIPSTATNGTIYYFNASFAGAREYYSSEAKGKIDVIKYATEIIINNGNDIEAYVGQTNITIPIVVNTEDGTPFNGLVNITYYNSSWGNNTQIRVNNGQTSIILNIPADAIIGESYPFKVSYDGNSTYIGSENSININIVKHTAQIVIGDIPNMYVGDSNTQSWNISLIPNHTAGSTDPYTVNVYVINNTEYVLIGTIDVNMNGTETFYENNILKTLDVGTYTIYANSTGDDNWTIYSGNNTINIVPVNLNITKEIVKVNDNVDNLTIIEEDNVTFKITINNNGDAVLHDVTVIDKDNQGLILVLGTYGEKWTYNNDGTWTYNGDLAPGESVELLVVFKVESGATANVANVTANGENANNTTTLPLVVIDKIPTSINVTSIDSIFPGELAVINITLIDNNGNIVKVNETINFTYTVNGLTVTTELTLVDGETSTNWTIPTTYTNGTVYYLKAEYPGDREYLPSVNDTATVTVIKYGTGIEVIPVISVVPGTNDVNIEVNVTTTDGTLFNGNITVQSDVFDNDKQVEIINGKGTLVFNVSDETAIGDYDIVFTYEGNNTYIGSTNTTVLTVYTIGTNLTVSSVVMYEGDPTPQDIRVLYSATEGQVGEDYIISLYYKNSADEYVFLANITVNKDISKTYSESTVFKTLVAGEYEIFANYTGDASHNPTNATGTLRILKLSDNVIINKTLVDSSNGDITDLYINDTVDYNITLANNGDAILHNITIYDKDYEGLEFIPQPYGDSWRYDSTTKSWAYIANGGSLAPHTSITLTLKFRVTADGTVTNNVTAVLNRGTEEDTLNNTTSTTVKSRNPTNVVITNYTNILPNTTVIMNVTIVDNDGILLTDSNGTVTIICSDGTTQNVEITAGEGSFAYTVPITSLRGDNITFNGTYSGNRVYEPSNGDGWINVTKYLTYITVDDISAYYGQTVNITVHVTEETGNPFNGNVTLTTPKGNVVVEIINGIGKSEYNITGTGLRPEANLTAEYAGNVTHNASVGTGVLKAREYTAEITINDIIMYEYDSSDKALNISLTLVNESISCGEEHAITIYVMNGTQRINLTTVQLTENSSTIYLENQVFKNLEVGIYELHAVTDVDEFHNITMGQSTLTIIKPDITINKTLINTTDLYVNDIIEFNITVVNNGSLNLTNVIVTDKIFNGLEFINTGSYGDWIYNNGTWTLTSLENNSNSSFIVRFKVTDYGELNNTAQLTVGTITDKNSTVIFNVNDRTKTNITVTNITVLPGTEVQMNISVVSESGEVLTNFTANVTVYNVSGGDNFEVEIINGTGNFTYLVAETTENGTKFDFDVVFGGNREFYGSESTGTINVLKYDTEITVTGDIKHSGENASVTITFTNATDGTLLNGTINITYPNGTVEEIEINGTRTIIIPVPENTVPGSYPVIVNYPGNYTYNPSSASNIIQVIKRNATLNIYDVVVYEGDTNNQTITIFLDSGDYIKTGNQTGVEYNANVYYQNATGDYVLIGTVPIALNTTAQLNASFADLVANNYKLYVNTSSDDFWDIASGEATLKVISVDFTVNKTIVSEDIPDNGIIYGDNVSFIINVTNNGEAVLHNITIKDSWPSALNFTGSEYSENWTYDAETGAWTYKGSLATGESASIIVNFTTIGWGEDLENLAIVTVNAHENTKVAKEIFNVSDKIHTVISVENITGVYPGDEVTVHINITAEDGAKLTGKVNVTIKDGENIVYTINDLNFNNGETSFDWTVPADAADLTNYTITVSYPGNREYYNSTGIGYIDVIKHDVEIIATNATTYPNGKVELEINVTVDNVTPFNGNITMKLHNGTEIIVPVNNGHAVVEYIAPNATGIYNITYEFVENATYRGATAPAHVNVTDFNVNNTKKAIDEKETYYVGDEVNFNITVTNNGNYTIDTVVITDNDHNGLRLITERVANWTYNSESGTWTYNNPLAKGESVTLTLKFIATINGTLTNTAIVELNNVKNNTTSTNVTVVKFTPIIEVENRTVYPGAHIEIPVIVDTDETGAKFNGNLTVIFDDGSNRTISIVNGSGVLDYIAPGLADVYNMTYVFVGNETYYAANTSATVTVVDFSVNNTKKAIDVKDITYVGDEVKFNITVNNTGNYTVDTVVITDTNHTGLDLIEEDYGADWTYNSESGTWTYNNPLAKGESVTLTLRFIATTNGTLTNVAVVSLNNGTKNETPSDNVTVVKFTPIIEVENITVYPNTHVIIPVNVTSDEGVPFNGILTVYLDGGLERKVTIVNGSGILDYISSNSTGVYNMTYVFVGNETYYAANTSATVTVIDFNVISNKTIVDGKEVYYIGDEVIFNITVTNIGNCTIQDVYVIDKNHTGLDWIGAIAENWTYDTNTGKWIYNYELASEESASLILIFNITKAGNLTNIAIVGLNNITKETPSANITVVKFTPVISVENITAYPDDDVVININVTSEEGAYDGEINVTLADGTVKTINITNGTGFVIWKVPMDAVNGTVYDVIAKIDETDKYYEAESAGTITVVQDEIIITVIDTQVYQGNNVTIPITVTDINGVGLTVNVTITLPDGSTRLVEVVDGVGSVVWFAPEDYAGNYSVKAEYNSPGRYIATNATGTVEVLEKINVIITTENQTGYPGSNITIPINLSDVDGNPITANVTVTLPNGTAVVVEIINGTGEVIWNVPEDTLADTYPVPINYYGNETTNPANATAYVEILNKKATVIISINITTENGTTVTIPISVYDEDGSPITGNVTVILPDGTVKVVEIINGKGSTTWFVPANYKKGKYPVFITFDGAEGLLPSETTIYITVIVKDNPKPTPIPPIHKHGIQMYKTGNPLALIPMILMIIFLLPLRRRKNDDDERGT